MLATTLQRMIDQKLTSAREMGDLAGVSTSTVYRWIAGQSQPDFDAVRLLVRHLPDPKAQEALLSVMTAGTDWNLAHLKMELDLNDDGRIDAQDALDASITAVRHAAESLGELRAQCHDGNTPDAESTLALISTLNEAVKHCTISQRVLLAMSEQRRKRKLKLAT